VCSAPFEPFEGQLFHVGHFQLSYRYLVSYPVLCYAPPARGGLSTGDQVPDSPESRWRDT
jgi:hypothetical protein